MKKQILLILSMTLVMFTSKIYAQNIAINSTGSLPDTSAMLDVSSTIKGMLVPRMTTTQQNAIPLPATGLLIYNTTTNYFDVNIGTSSSPNWVPLAFTGGGITTLNGLTNATQTFATGTSGSDFGITSSGSTHTLNLPDASATARGAITTGTQTIAGAKTFSGNTSIGGSLNVTGATTLGGAITASSVSSGASTDSIVTINTSGIIRKRTVASVLAGAITNALASATNTLTSTVNGVAANASIINSNALSLSGTTVTSTVNGVASNALDISAIDSSIYKFDGALRANRTVTMAGNNLTFGSTTGNFIFNPSSTGKLGIGTTTPSSTLDVVGTTTIETLGSGATTDSIVTASATGVLRKRTVASVLAGATTVSNNSSTNTLTTTVNGVTGTGVNIINSNALSSATNTLTSTVNGVAANASIINTNALSLSTGNLTSTINGVASNVLSLSGLDSNIYKNDGSLTANRTVTMAGNNLTFGSTTGNFIFNPSSTGKLGIGTASPGQLVETMNGNIFINNNNNTSGQLRINEPSTSGSNYTAFQAQAQAANITYTLPAAQGSASTVLTNDGSGNLSWAAPNVGWSLTGNSGTTSATNFLGTTDAKSLEIRTNNTNRLFIDSIGNVGIGKTTPSKTLDVLGNVSGANIITIENSNAAGYSSMDFISSAGSLSSTFGYANASTGGIFSGRAYMNSYGNDFVLTRNSSEYSIFIQGSSGNVGYSTNTPNSKMEVNGAFATTLSTQSTSGSSVTLDNTASVWYFKSSFNSTIYLPTASTCTYRRYVIVNVSGASRTVYVTGSSSTGFNNLASAANTTSISNGTSIEIISDGTNWLQIK